MTLIYKYPIRLSVSPSLVLPRGARVLSAQLQRGQLVLWALVDPNAPTEHRRVRVVGTGHPVDGVDAMEHVATVQDGDYVWHLFIDTPPTT